MRIGFGADHRGLIVKRALMESVERDGHEVEDFGTRTTERCDFPDFALAVSEAVLEGKVRFGVLVCGSGVGMSIAANKVRGIRAALCSSEEQARMARAHNDANVLVFAGDFVPPQTAISVTRVFLATEFVGGDVYVARLRKVGKIEEARG